jgi:hypothetical protein
MIPAPYPCKHCGKLPEQHANGKCLFDSTEYHYTAEPVDTPAPIVYYAKSRRNVCSRCGVVIGEANIWSEHTQPMCILALGTALRDLQERLRGD